MESIIELLQSIVHHAAEIGIVIAGAYVSRGIVRKLVSAVPVLGFAFKTGVAYGTTTAVGYAIIEYFEGGEDATGVANVLERATETSSKLAAFAQDKAAKYAPRLVEAAPQLTEALTK